MSARNPRGGAAIPKGAVGAYQREHANTIGAGIESMVPGHRSWYVPPAPKCRCSCCGREKEAEPQSICTKCKDGWMVEVLQ